MMYHVISFYSIILGNKEGGEEVKKNDHLFFFYFCTDPSQRHPFGQFLIRSKLRLQIMALQEVIVLSIVLIHRVRGHHNIGRYQHPHKNTAMPHNFQIGLTTSNRIGSDRIDF